MQVCGNNLRSLIPVVLLIAAVLGSIYSGVATATSMIAINSRCSER